jgi:hypothetical protein
LIVLVLVLVAALRLSAAQSGPSPTNDAPNPYRTVENWAQLPEGRKWGSLSAVDVDKDGKSIWVAERCGGNSACLDAPTVDPILKFDSSGKLLKSFGAGLLVSPHGIYVDRDGNIWVTDYQDNAPRPARGAAPAAGLQLVRLRSPHLRLLPFRRQRAGPPVPPRARPKATRCSSSVRTASC